MIFDFRTPDGKAVDFADLSADDQTNAMNYELGYQRGWRDAHDVATVAATDAATRFVTAKAATVPTGPAGDITQAIGAAIAEALSAAALNVRVVGSPARVTRREVQRDEAGRIIGTVDVEQDA